MAHYVHLIERSTPTGGILRDLDLANSTGTSVYRLKKFRQGEPRYKETWSSSPLKPSQQLKHFELDASESEITIAIEAATVNAALAALNNLDRFFKDARTAQVLRYENKPSTYFYLEVYPAGATRTSKTQILAGGARRPDSFFDEDILASVIEDIELGLKHDPYFSASIYNLVSAASRNNGYNNHVDIAASGAGYVDGDQDAPIRIRVTGGDIATNRLLIAARVADDPTLFNHHRWAKDATLFNNTVVVTDGAAFDGNNTGQATKTTAANTNENLTHRWIVTTNVKQQYGRFRVFGIGKRTAAVYSARGRVGLYDGTNIVYPDDVTGGYSPENAVSVGAHSGANLALFDLGEIQVPTPSVGAQTVYGLVYEIYTTCSDITGSPEFYLDEIRLMPIGEGANGTGFADITLPLGSGATGVGAAALAAFVDYPPAALVNGSDVTTFLAKIENGDALWLPPQKTARLFCALVDATNSRLDHTKTLTITVDYELRHGGVIGL